MQGDWNLSSHNNRVDIYNTPSSLDIYQELNTRQILRLGLVIIYQCVELYMNAH